MAYLGQTPPYTGAPSNPNPPRLNFMNGQIMETPQDRALPPAPLSAPPRPASFTRNNQDPFSSNTNSNRNSMASSFNDDLEKKQLAIKQEEHDAHHHANTADRPKLPLRARMKHFTWAWFTLTMSTGGLSLLIFAQPHQFPGLLQIGMAVYVIFLIMFAGVMSGMLTRFFLYPGTFSGSLTHRREGFFFPTFFLTLATLITSTQRYVVHGASHDSNMTWAIQAAFWIYLIMTLLVAIGQYSYVFSKQNFGLATMMPTWILPIFPIMLSGTIASVIAATQPEITATTIIVAGLTCQGLGMTVSLMMYAHMVGRLMSAGLPHREHRPGLFMNVGPPAFTALAVLGMANGLPQNFDANGDGVPEVLMIRVIATMVATSLWALSLWWFGIAALAVIQAPPEFFHLGWWAMVFPNTGFTLATISLGQAFASEAVLWFATAMSIVLFLMYCFVLYHHVRAVVVQDIMYPNRDEDVEDH